MTSELLARLRKLTDEIKCINEELQSNLDSDYSLQVTDTENSSIIIGNTDGLINLATYVLDLALSRKDGQHYHFGAGALDNYEKELEILYKSFESCEVIYLNIIEGYRAMYNFLKSYYQNSKSNELGILLGSMSLLSDNIPADSAYKKHWEDAVSQIVGQGEIDVFSSDTIYCAMIAFLRNWCDLGTDGTIRRLYEDFEKAGPRRAEWLDAVKTVMGVDDDPYLHLIK